MLFLDLFTTPLSYRGDPVAMAGDIWIEKGRIIKIAVKSGHYKPDSSTLAQLIRYLEESWVYPSDTAVNLIGN